jgi:hypothetical protein
MFSPYESLVYLESTRLAGITNGLGDSKLPHSGVYAVRNEMLSMEEFFFANYSSGTPRPGVLELCRKLFGPG